MSVNKEQKPVSHNLEMTTIEQKHDESLDDVGFLIG